MRTQFPEKVLGTNLRDIKSGGGHPRVPRVIYYAPAHSNCQIEINDPFSLSYLRQISFTLLL